jgi:phage shock protein PspC (stress-responsive transcriptional regulator)
MTVLKYLEFVFLSLRTDYLLYDFCSDLTRFCFWPVWVPFVCLVLSLYNPTKIYRYILVTFFLCGFGLFLYMILSLSINGLSISSEDGHIVYHISLLSSTPYGVTAPYLLCTILPFLFIPSVRLSWIFSATVGGSAIASYVIYQHSFPSTWCYFAAWLSLQVVSLRTYDIYRYQLRESPPHRQNNFNRNSSDARDVV